MTTDMHGMCHHLDADPILVRIGCAGWSLPKEAQGAFAAEGSHLERYASRFNAVEINSSFYRPHKPATYARWAASVPADFRFSVKVPKAITHENRLNNSGELMAAFLAEAGQLGDKLGCLLVQLPPSLAFQGDVVKAFFTMLRGQHGGPVVIEPRHASWFGDEARELLLAHRVRTVLADPAPCAGSVWPIADGVPSETSPQVAYYRLHGSPRIYHDSYGEAFLQALAGRLREEARDTEAVWCVFDNTAQGAATANALTLAGLITSLFVEQGRDQNKK